MRESNKKIIIAFELVVLVLISSVVITVNVDKLKDVFSQPESDASNILEDDSSKDDEIIPSTTEDVIELLQQLDESMMLGYLQKLTSFGPHPTAHRILGKVFDLPIEKVRKYLINELESMGLDVKTQAWEQEPTLRNIRVPSYYLGWFEGENIEATLHGTDKGSDEIYLIIAHYDTWRRSLGADDDGSGVAAILAIAKVMSQYKFNHTIRFVTVSGHEQGLLGSNFYVKEALDNNDNIVATICVDMIGDPGTESEENKVRIFENEQSSWITNFTIIINKRYFDFLNFEIITVDDPKGHVSDYLNFWEYGFHAAFYHEIIMTEKRHTPKDTIANMDVTYATKITKLAMATIAELAWGE